MHVILVYDVGEQRVGRICKLCKQYLPRVQNSVFEGELTESKLVRLKTELRRRMEEEDAVIIWVLQDARRAERQILGREKLPHSNFL